MSFSITPRLSAYDPAAEGEGSLDPLGLEAAAERLADQLLPGMTARMHRVRALTFMAVSAHVTAPYVDEYTADQRTPAFLVFEWMFAEAMAIEDVETTSIPGIQTAARALNGNGHLAAQIYLKSPRALGLHGFYRRLARATRIIDGSDILGENGESLVRAWERDQELEGFYEGTGRGATACKSLRSALEEGLRESRCCLHRRTSGGSVLRKSLRPAFPTKSSRERKELRRVLDEDPRRQETLELLEHGLAADAFAYEEGDVAQWIADHGSDGLAASASALLAFERVSGLLTDAFDELRFSSSTSQMVPRRPDRLVSDGHVRIARDLRPAMAALERATGLVEPDQARDEAVNSYVDVRSPVELVDALLARHEKVQGSKGREGKRPWFERTERGIAVRPGYALDYEPEPTAGFMHQTRLTSARDFLNELK